MMDNQASERSPIVYTSPPVDEYGEGAIPKILIINARSSLYDGHTQRGLADHELFSQELAQLDDLRKPGMPHFSVQHLAELDFSADQGHTTWEAIASMIHAEYANYSGFVVQFGTDTMTYAATALSFMLENLGKPVMFTGSVISANEVHSDMKRNIILALLFAQNSDICEVCIVFGECLFRANRTTKLSRRTLQPFETPNLQPLATLRGNRVALEKRLLLPAPRGRLCVHLDMSSIVFTIKIVPGVMTKLTRERLLATTAPAVVLVCFGKGNVAARDPSLLVTIKSLVDRGTVVAVCTQNRFGAVELNDYDTGRHLEKTGAVPVNDMTTEATILKIKYLLGKGLTPSAVATQLTQSLRGEVSASMSHL